MSYRNRGNSKGGTYLDDTNDSNDTDGSGDYEIATQETPNEFYAIDMPAVLRALPFGFRFPSERTPRREELDCKGKVDDDTDEGDE